MLAGEKFCSIKLQPFPSFPFLICILKDNLCVSIRLNLCLRNMQHLFLTAKGDAREMHFKWKESFCACEEHLLQWSFLS